MYLVFICLVPFFVQSMFINKVPFIFGGTGVLISVSVSIEIIKKINGYYVDNDYGHILK